jgi:hypothetical protein
MLAIGHYARPFASIVNLVTQVRPYKTAAKDANTVFFHVHYHALVALMAVTIAFK